MIRPDFCRAFDRRFAGEDATAVNVMIFAAVCLVTALSAPAHADTVTISEAVADEGRPPADRERDARSRPIEVLGLIGVPEALPEGSPQNAVVLDLFGGGGYYSEIISRALGDAGTVYLHNNAAYLEFAGEALEERLSGNRLPNVVRYDRELDAIDLADDSVDLVLMVMTYHDLYYKTDGWDLDPDAFFETLHRILKHGGVLAVIDHVAEEGTGVAAAQICIASIRFSPAATSKDAASS